MPKLPRVNQRIFASGITPTGNIAVFGSLAEGTPTYSADTALIQSRPPWVQGWASATVGNQSPAYQDFNGYQYVVTSQLKYLFQAGIPEWISTETYYIGSFCSVAGVIYRSKTDNNTGNAVTDTVNWEVLLAPVATSGSYVDLTNKPTGQLARAWVTFQGNGAVGNQVINGQFGVSSVNKTATGRYTVNFTTPIGSSNYTVSPSSIDIGSENQAYQVTYAAKGSSSCGIIVRSGVTTYIYADSPNISVVFFAL